jgi:hypothetical protein
MFSSMFSSTISLNNVDDLAFVIVFIMTAYGLFNFLKKIKALHHETERVNSTGYFEGPNKVQEINTPEKWRKSTIVARP